MFTHEEIWRGIDRLARHAGTSPSGLARRAGLDATTFNPSKRISADGSKPRWPSTESLAKALGAARLDLDAFARLVRGDRTQIGLPALDLAETTEPAGFTRFGDPQGEAWDATPFPGMTLDNAVALRVGDDRYAPVYRRGDRLIIQRDLDTPTGARVILRLQAGSLVAGALGVASATCIVLDPLRDDHARMRIELSEIDWLARIIWVSQ